MIHKTSVLHKDKARKISARNYAHFISAAKEIFSIIMLPLGKSPATWPHGRVELITLPLLFLPFTLYLLRLNIQHPHPGFSEADSTSDSPLGR